MNEDGPITIFVAGTDTDVGKTYVAALIARMYRNSGVRVGVYKPVASGCALIDGDLVADDAVELWHSAGQPRTLADVCPQRFQAAVAPVEAARLEGAVVDVSLLRSGAELWSGDCDVLIVEGAGGLFSPLADGVLNLDLAQQFSQCRMIVVAANCLGTIHQTLATCAAASHHDVQVDGLILNTVSVDPDPSRQTNAAQIQRYCTAPVLGEVAYRARQVPQPIAKWFLDYLK